MEQNTAPNPAEPSNDGSLDEGASLESSGPVVDQSSASTVPALTPVSGGSPAPKRESILRKLWHRGSIYLLAFGLLFVIAGIVIIVLYARNQDKASTATPTVKTQDLSAETLQQLANTNGLQVGDAKQVLNIQSNAVFAGTALIKGDLQVGGTIRTGGSLSLTGLTVTGPGSFQNLQAQDLAVAGRGAFTGQLSTQGSLNVGGSGSFSGPVSTPTLNANTLQLAGNLVLNNHIQAGGARPGASGGNALGSGGTTNISGSDTAGTIVINTGGGPGAGCFTNISFAKSFSSPRVIVTPVGGAAGGLQWYVNRNSNGFSVCTNSPAGAGQSFAFDYFVVD